MSVEYKRKEYVDALPRWMIVDDTQKGELAVKARKGGRQYLPFYGTPKLGAESFDSNSDAYNTYLRTYATLTRNEQVRYNNFLLRAAFYNYVARTIGGLVGMATKDPLTVEVGTGLEFVKTDIDGAGTSLDQQYKRVLELNVKHARAGVLVDYPPTDGQVSQADINNGVARSYSTLYRAPQIINWGYERVGADTRLNLVVIEECNQERGEDGFTIENVTQYRVLKLVNGIYEQTVMNDKDEVIEGPYTPSLASGESLNYIPFQFFGAVENDAEIDESTMFDIATLNIYHYQSSANYRNAESLVGQPQGVVSGVDQHWFENVMGGVITLGSGACLALPVGADFKYAQVTESSMSIEAMRYLSDQMIALGAKIMSGDTSFNSATEANINNQSETSYLDSVQKNTTAGYDNILAWMAEFEGSEVEAFDNPTDLSVVTADPQMSAQVTADWMAGLIATTDARDYKRKIGTLERTDEEIDEDILSEPNPNMDAEGENQA